MSSHEAAPLGATVVDGGVEFAVFSRNAGRIDVVLFRDDGNHETARHTLERGKDGIHRALVAGARAGTRYGLRAHGDHAPGRGHRFDPSKLLVDPHARRIDRPFAPDPRLARFGFDTQTLVPKGIVTEAVDSAPLDRPGFRAGGFVYELAVKPFTKLHPQIEPEWRGTVAALGHPAVLDHLGRLGVDAVELMPITAWIDEPHLPPLGLTNGWGYNPVSYLALDPRLAPGGIAELRGAVETLHSRGIAVILDVVFNHTGEGDADGPTLSLRGLDNAVYYRHAGNDPGALVNDTGCGNTLACERAPVQRLILDAMRHFVRSAGIDGFRFDLAPILGRDGTGYDRDAALFAAIAADPLLSDRTLIAEPWDIGPGGYQLGNFPEPFLEWNDQFRDDVRRFWRGDEAMLGALAMRLSGSSDIFRPNGDRRSRSVNFIAAHDGLALADITAYASKHNLANGEDNRDGHDENLSWNAGIEGPADDADIRIRRRADAKALIATLFASRGTIMLTAGDEFGRTQQGNNNAYAQDNALTWLDWDGRDLELEAHAALWSRWRRRLAVLGDPGFLDGRRGGAEDVPDVVWLNPQGLSMTVEDWEADDGEAIAMVLASPADDNSGYGRIAVLFNRGPAAVTFTMPPPPDGRWMRLDDHAGHVGTGIAVAPRSVALAGEALDPEAFAGP